MNQQHLSLGLIVTGTVVFLYSLWKKFRPETPAHQSPASPSSRQVPLDNSKFGSDEPPPPRTIEFNKSIIEACGSKLTAEQKIEMLCLPSVTRAEALLKAREILEQSLSTAANPTPPVSTVP